MKIHSSLAAAVLAVLALAPGASVHARPAALPFQCPESRDEQVMIHVDGAFARASNSFNSPPVGRLLKFQCYRVIGRDGSNEWIYARYGNGATWIHRNDVRVKDGALVDNFRVLYPADLITAAPAVLRFPGVPTVSARTQELYKQAVKAGRRPDVVSVMGDCNSESPVYFGRLAAGVVNLSAAPELTRVATYFAPSFQRGSQATHGSFSSGMAFDNAWSDPDVCGSDGPLACELRKSNASIVIIALGTGDTFSWQSYDGNLRRVIEYALQNNVVPVLMTKADALETQQGKAPVDHINNTVRALGAQYGVPVIDFAAAVRTLPDRGLVDERTTDGKSIEPFHISELGMDARIVMTLQTLLQFPDAKLIKAPAVKPTPAPRRRLPRPTPTPKR
jgi:hypothetical protein